MSRAEVEIWCRAQRNGRGETEVECLNVWSGGMVAVPRQGDQLILFEGMGPSTVLAVFWDLPNDVVTIEIAPDSTGEYLEAMTGDQEKTG